MGSFFYRILFICKLLSLTMLDFGSTLFHPLSSIKNIELPKLFTYPFYYEPHELSILAAKHLQTYLEKQNDFEHNFGLDPNKKGLKIGKMFGVMVVKNAEGVLGFLAAFSGKLAESNYLKGFVPTVYDTLDKKGFYKKGEAKLNAFNRQIKLLEADASLKEAKYYLENSINQYKKELAQFKHKIKEEKKKRKALREEALNKLAIDDYKILDETLKKQSIYFHFRLKDLKKEWDSKIEEAKINLKERLQPLNKLKEERSTLSASLQKRLHQHYRFLNAKGEVKDLLDIFKTTSNPIPPAGSGECAAPKLFQYAYENNLKPIAMSEFWWGVSPKSQVRKHQQFYPSCRSKCEPILGHMMKGLQVEENPIAKEMAYKQPLEIVYEDDYLLLVNKPHEFLSVPGKRIKESVLSRMRHYLPKAKGPLLVHRLDMSTSGLLLVAKNEKTHKRLQKQFIDRTIKKRYVALLDGEIIQKEGIIDLPLRVDLDNRPQQLVCYNYGKPAKTKYKIISIENKKTRIYFYPITGRTHQLRVHAAHANGLNIPILGDDLYGVKGDRLHLHAELLQFTHPVTNEALEIICKPPF